MTSTTEIHLAVTFAEIIRQAGNALLYEGLPHQLFESDLLAKERQSKPVLELNGYPFYDGLLALHEPNASRFTQVFAELSTYQPFSGEKWCGGFHPDYALEWPYAKDFYRALICFGCQEVKLFGPDFESRNDLNPSAYQELQGLLKSYRKNRPASKHAASRDILGAVKGFVRASAARVGRFLRLPNP